MTNKVARLKVLRYIIIVLLVGFYFLLTQPLFQVSYSTLITGEKDELLGALIADDGQWRFPAGDSIPIKYEKALLCFEDVHFYYHPGVNVLSFARAFFQNIKAGSIKSGGSTITMQVVRLASPKDRTILNKLFEMIMALRVECKYSKSDILNLYASHAPFGGNVVGLETASWRYFSRPSYQLSWAESATLAVLPNSPGLIHPGRNRTALKNKRDRLLSKLYQKNVIDEIEYLLALEEPVVDSPELLPDNAMHVLMYCRKLAKGKRYKTTIDGDFQKQVDALVNRHANQLASSQIHNIGVLVISNKDNRVIAYIGNSKGKNGSDNGNDVDVIRSPRSSGSILKPFLYASAMHQGLILPQSLLADIPTYYTDFAPQNYQRTFDGAVKASDALARSLNIPAVRLLDDYGVDHFLQFLKSLGLSTLPYSSDHYGLSLILGGAETNLWDLTSAYASMARVLSRYGQEGKYSGEDWRQPVLIEFEKKDKGEHSSTVEKISAGAIWNTFQALTQVNRPDEQAGWEMFSNHRRIAWKTGTSFGYRDAWAIGVTPEYTIGVWVGNATGEGRPGIVGGSTAGPILFDVFGLLPKTSWFQEPFDDLVDAAICHQSGMLALSNCPDKDSVLVPISIGNQPVCKYHQRVFLDKTLSYRVNASCYNQTQMVAKSWFVLPPLMEWYYKNRNPYYQSLPPMHPNCQSDELMPMEFIYPRAGSALYLPTNFNGETEQVVLKVAHRQANATLFWSVDESYIGETNQFHQMNVLFTPGWHTITVMDEAGNRIQRRIQCLNKE